MLEIVATVIRACPYNDEVERIRMSALGVGTVVDVVVMPVDVAVRLAVLGADRIGRGTSPR